MSPGYLVLGNGDVFCGERFGAQSDALGELVFTTGMCGYIETLTDPSYSGQIVLHTFPQIGNYGVIGADFEGTPALRGYIVREWCEAPSNFRCEGDLDSFLRAQGIPGLCGIDTREVTRRIREFGVMNAMICSAVPDDLSLINDYRITNAVASVSTGASRSYPAKGAQKYRVTLIDYGAKGNIVRHLTALGVSVTEVPYNTSAEEILAAAPDGVMLSNGPGDPAENTGCINEISKLLGQLPMFGICLGHQLMALAAGGRTVKLKYGHRGANQPVRETRGMRTYITSQNHGYAVDSANISEGRVSFVNANDGTCEGVEYDSLGAFSVQFHPEAASGPHDTGFLFERFVRMMEERR